MKRHVLLALYTAAGLLAPSATLLSSPVTAHAAVFPTLSYGSQGNAVKSLQSRLKAAGYNVGPIDGNYGALTEATVKKFQAAHHLAVDGVAGPQTFSALASLSSSQSVGKIDTRPPTPKPTAAPLSSLPTSQVVLYGSRGHAVEVVQTAMNKLGFPCGTVDGIYGPMTAHAIQAFQRAHGLHVDGIVGRNTWAALKSALGGYVAPAPTHASPPSSGSTGNTSGGNATTTKTPPTTTPPPTTSQAPQAPRIAYPGTLIRFGLRGEAVKEVQTRLNQLGYHCGPDDGIYGPMTYAAIRRFQAAHQLQVDGIVGPQSWPKLFPPSSPVSTPPVTSTPSTPPSTSPPSSGSQTTSRGTDPLTVFTAFAANQQKVGTYSSQAAAEQALSSQPGGYVENGNAKVIWRQGDFTAVDKSGKLLGHYVSETAAQQVVSNSPGGKVYNAQSPSTPVYVSPDYLAYESSGKLVDETVSLSTAKSAIAKDPLGTVRDANRNNQVVYTQPDVYAAYQSPDGTPEDTTSLQTATAYSQTTTRGFVIDLGHDSLAVQPEDYFYLSSSKQWLHHLQGVTVPTGSASPSWAKQGEVYVALETPSPPYYYDYYQISHVASPRRSGTYENPFRTVDLRYNAPSTITATAINKWLASVNSPLSGLGNAFVQAQTDYGVNDAYLAAHAFQETGNATMWTPNSIPVTKNNLFGYGAYTLSPSSAASFPSAGYSVLFQGWFIRENYLNDGAHFRYQWPTLDGMNKYYATDHNWSSNIAAYMDALASSVNTTSSNFHLYNPSNQPPSPATEQEPTYYLKGATGVVGSGSGSVTGLSNYEMRPELFVGAKGYWVKQMQTAYNTWLGLMHQQNKLLNLAPVTVDGQLGQAMDAALKQFQTEQNIGVDGICGPQTWGHLEQASNQVTQVAIPANSKVTIDEVRMGDNLSDWYHVTVDGTHTSAWVSASDLTLTNVYKVMPASGYEVSLANGATLRGGEYIVSSDGKTSVTYVDQSNPNSVQTTTLKTGSLQRVSR